MKKIEERSNGRREEGKARYREAAKDNDIAVEK